MPNLEFNYVTLREKHYPLIPIRLYHEGRNVKTYALLDSGSTISVFRNEIAEDLGIGTRGGKEQILQSANGLIKVYVYALTVEINDERFDMNVGFSSDLITSFNILGREGFFDRFRITFDEEHRKIMIET
jgi:predicted aspartyl protease